VYRTTSELPDEPAVHRSGERVAFGDRFGNFRFCQQKLELRRGKVWIDWKPSPFSNPRCLDRQLATAICRAAILPDDRTRQRLTRSAVPHDYRFALIRDSNDVGSDAARGDRFATCLDSLRENLGGIVLDPARTRKELIYVAGSPPDDFS
jgi:hypothetical protein